MTGRRPGRHACRSRWVRRPRRRPWTGAGYTLRRDLWGLGLATEVATGLVDWHHGNSDAELWALAAIENLASRRVLDKVGFGYMSDADHNDTPCAPYRLGA